MTARASRLLGLARRRDLGAVRASVSSEPLLASNYRPLLEQRPRNFVTTAASNRKLVEVGRLGSVSPLPYEGGQVFVHRLFAYRGIILYSWQAKVYDKTPDGKTKPEPPKMPLGIGPSTTHFSQGQELQGTTQTYYKVLIDNQDRPYLRMPLDEGFTLLSAESGDPGRSSLQSLYTVRGIDFVSHDDIVPIETRIPIQHELFPEFFEASAEAAATRFVGKPTLAAWRAKYEAFFDVSTINRETTSDVRITVIPFYIGYRDSRATRDYFWQYTVRMENLGSEIVTLRERLWKVFSISGTLENVNGRGVVGYEPTLSAVSPAWQYSSHVSLKATSGHMWGEFLFEGESGQDIRVKIPPFTLESVQDKEPTPPPPPDS